MLKTSCSRLERMRTTKQEAEVGGEETRMLGLLLLQFQDTGKHANKYMQNKIKIKTLFIEVLKDYMA